MYKRICFFPVAVVMLFAACQAELKEEMLEEQPFKKEDGRVPPEITATHENGRATKSVLEVDGEGIGTIYWTPADEINVFYGTTGTHYVSQNTEIVSTAVFKTTDVIGINEGSSDNIWGLYPYNEHATCTGSAVNTNLPSAQYGVPGTFDDNLFITLANNPTTALEFYNVCGGIKFSLSRDDIAQISFRGNNGEDLAGDISLSFVEGLPSSSVTSGTREISLQPKTGSAFVSGENYYIVLLPVVLSEGFTMTFTTVEGVAGVFNYSDKAVTIKRSVFSRKENIDTFATFRRTKHLSENGAANSYIVSAPGTYYFDAVKGNSYESVGSIKGVKVLWESFGSTVAPSVGDLIKADVSYSDGYIRFETHDVFTEGNAVIAAYSDELCSDGNVLWSWHIWLTDQPEEQVYANNAGTMMDRNLGATSASPGEVGAYGLMYQWGRKDPFLGSGTHPVSGTLAASTLDWPDYVLSDANYGTEAYSIQHPTTFISRGSGNNDWLYLGLEKASRWSGSGKSVYDPCPAGWQVPSVGIWSTAGFADHSYVAYDADNKGILFDSSLCGSDSWYPLAGYSSTSGTLSNWGIGSLWSSTQGTTPDNDWAWSYYFAYREQDFPDKASAASGVFEKYYMMPVRCCKENTAETGVSFFDIDKKVLGVSVGAEKTILATIKPDSQSYRTVSWTSSNKAVATVSDDGVVTGISEGETTITASVDGKSVTCSVLVGDYAEGIIPFADAECKNICIGKWDKDGDGELSYVEAAFVKEICREFANSTITSFDEFQYFVNCTEISSYEYYSDGDNNADGAFEGVSTLTSITLPPKMKCLGENCFHACSALSSIVLPATVTSLGYACFCYCSSLNSVTVLATTPPTLSFYDTYYEVQQTDPKTFYDVPGNIYVPAAAASTYKSATGWSRYASKIVGQ